MKRKWSTKWALDLGVYIFAAFCDSFGIALMIQTHFGATPFGILTSNAALVFHLTVGGCSFVYETVCIVVAGKISKGRMKWELFTYSVIFAVLIDLHLRLLPDFSHLNLFYKLGITLFAIALIDLAKSFFLISVFPKLSTVELLSQISERYQLKLGKVSKLINGWNLVLGIVLSCFARKPFYNVGIGTVMAFLLFGSVFQITSPLVRNRYLKLVVSLNKKQDCKL
jgi:uncharacterized membrane protein YczE